MKYAVIYKDTITECVGASLSVVKVAYPGALEYRPMPEEWSTKGESLRAKFDENLNLKPLEQQAEEGTIEIPTDYKIENEDFVVKTDADKWLENPDPAHKLEVSGDDLIVVDKPLVERYIDGEDVGAELNEEIRATRADLYNYEVNGRQAGVIADYFLGKLTEDEMKAQLKELDDLKASIKEENPYVYE